MLCHEGYLASASATRNSHGDGLVGLDIDITVGGRLTAGGAAELGEPQLDGAHATSHQLRKTMEDLCGELIVVTTRFDQPTTVEAQGSGRLPGANLKDRVPFIEQRGPAEGVAGR